MMPRYYVPDYGDEYDAAHVLVREVRGRASGYSCAHCGRPARDWATVHGIKKYTDVWSDFIHLCQSCHRKYDAPEIAAIRRKRRLLEKAERDQQREAKERSEKKYRALAPCREAAGRIERELSPEMLSIAETARVMGLRESSIRYMIRDGELPAETSDGKLKVPLAYLERLARATIQEWELGRKTA